MWYSLQRVRDQGWVRVVWLVGGQCLQSHWMHMVEERGFGEEGGICLGGLRMVGTVEG